MVQLYPLEQELKDIIIRTNKVMNRWKITHLREMANVIEKIDMLTT